MEHEARDRSFDAEVVRQELPRSLPGYITIAMVAETGTFETHVIDTDESEDHFAIGQIVRIDAATGDGDNVAYSTPWWLHGAPRKQRVTLLPR